MKSGLFGSYTMIETHLISFACVCATLVGFGWREDFLDVKLLALHPWRAPVPLVLPQIKVHGHICLLLCVPEATVLAHCSAWFSKRVLEVLRYSRVNTQRLELLWACLPLLWKLTREALIVHQPCWASEGVGWLAIMGSNMEAVRLFITRRIIEQTSLVPAPPFVITQIVALTLSCLSRPPIAYFLAFEVVAVAVLNAWFVTFPMAYVVAELHVVKVALGSLRLLSQFFFFE